MEDETGESAQADLQAAVAEGLAQSLRDESTLIDFTEFKRELRAKLNQAD